MDMDEFYSERVLDAWVFRKEDGKCSNLFRLIDEVWKLREGSFAWGTEFNYTSEIPDSVSELMRKISAMCRKICQIIDESYTEHHKWALHLEHRSHKTYDKSDWLHKALRKESYELDWHIEKMWTAVIYMDIGEHLNGGRLLVRKSEDDKTPETINIKNGMGVLLHPNQEHAVEQIPYDGYGPRKIMTIFLEQKINC